MNYYEILEIPEDASPAAITTAYRRLAKLHHPDVRYDAQARFHEIAEAHKTLSDPERRATYDAAGMLGSEYHDLIGAMTQEFASAVHVWLMAMTQGAHVDPFDLVRDKMGMAQRRAHESILEGTGKLQHLATLRSRLRRDGKPLGEASPLVKHVDNEIKKTTLEIAGLREALVLSQRFLAVWQSYSLHDDGAEPTSLLRSRFGGTHRGGW